MVSAQAIKDEGLTMAQQELPEVMTPAELAEYLRTTTASLSQDRYLGQGVPFVKYGKRVRYMRQDVLDYLAANRQRTDPRRVASA